MIILNIDVVVDVICLLNEGVILFFNFMVGIWYWKMYVEIGLFDLNKLIFEYILEEYDWLLYGKVERINILSVGDMNVMYEGIVIWFMWINVYIEKEIMKKIVKVLEMYIKMDICLEC